MRLDGGAEGSGFGSGVSCFNGNGDSEQHAHAENLLGERDHNYRRVRSVVKDTGCAGLIVADEARRHRVPYPYSSLENNVIPRE